MKLGILKKFIIAFLLLSLLPLIVLSFYTRFRLSSVSDIIVDNNRASLMSSSMSLLESKVKIMAVQIGHLLDQGLEDLEMIAAFPPDSELYRTFVNGRQRKVSDPFSESVAMGRGKTLIPMYHDMGLFDSQDKKTIYIQEGEIQAQEEAESYLFSLIRNSQEDEGSLKTCSIHVNYQDSSRPDISGIIKKQGAVEKISNRFGFMGSIQFVKKVWQDQKIDKFFSLSMDLRHLLELARTRFPFDTQAGDIQEVESGSYAIVFDETGKQIVQAGDQEQGSIEKAVLKSITDEVLQGKSSVIQTKGSDGVLRFLAYTPIPLGNEPDQLPIYFGGIILEARADALNQALSHPLDKIDQILKNTADNSILLIIVTGLVVSVIAAFLANTFTRPIRILTEKIKEISAGKYDLGIEISTGDELEVLGKNFQEMGVKLKEHEAHLVRSMADLEKHIDILKKIHSGSHRLRLSLDKDKVYDVILKTCVDGIGFRRALLYMLEKETNQLCCVKSYGIDSRQLDSLLEKRINLLKSVSPDGAVPWSSKDLYEEGVLKLASHNIASWIPDGCFTCTSITIAGKSAGVLAVDIESQDQFVQEKKMEPLHIIANEAGMAIERALLMEAAVKRRDFIESIFSNMLSGLIVYTNDGKIISANSKSQTFFKRSQDQMLATTMQEILEPYPAFLELVMKKQPAEQFFGSPVDLKLSGSKTIYLEISITSLSGTSEINEETKLLIFRDVTERKMVEKHISRADKLVSLGVLAAGIAHEIRNPLTGITLMLDDLHDRMANRTTDRLMIQRALEAIEKLENIVTRLLDFASKPMHKPILKNINAVIDDTLFFIKKQCTRQGVVLIKDVTASLPKVNIDEERIRQAILNIVLNALNVLKNGGEIKISTRLSEKEDIFAHGKAVVLSIADNGPGIDKDDINYIFDPFFSHNPDGFGLGLSITHTIVEDHGGKILVKSEPGNGACFDIYLPAT